MPRQLIVAADDFNLTTGVSQGIVEGHLRGILTSTAVMANLPGLEGNAARLTAAPRLAVGLHVNLTLGAPVLPPERVPSLVGPEGRFPRDRARLAHSAAAEVRAEVRAQAERFRAALGRPPGHLDSHHHVHAQPVVLAAVLDLAAALAVPVRAVSPEMQTAIRARGLCCPDRFVGDVAEAAYWTVERLRRLAGELGEGVTELCSHPGRWDPALAISSYGRQREIELRAFCDPAARAAFAAAGVELISYRELLAG